MDKNKISKDVVEFKQEFIEMMQTEEGIPDIITNKYNIEKQLFKSKRSEVYLITDKKGNKHILKVYDQQESTSDNNIITSLNHPNIPKFTAKYIVNDRVYFIREYCEGITLTQYLEENGVMSSKMIVMYIKSLLDILDYLHNRENPIIYRDIKGENIIISGNDVKLIDFDIARNFNKKASKDTVYYGTKQFSAPEQFGYQQTDARTDIYSVGVLMLYMATMTTDIQRLDTMDNKEFAEIIRKCTAFSPDERYSNVDELEKAITQYERFRFGKKNKSYRYLLYAAVVLVVIIVSFVIYTNYFHDNRLLGNEPSSEQPMTAGEPIPSPLPQITAEPSQDITAEPTVEPTPTAQKVFAKNDIAEFQSDVIEDAVRAQLKKGADEDIYIFELDEIEYLFIWGDTFYDFSDRLLLGDLSNYPDFNVVFESHQSGRYEKVEKGNITSLDDLLMFDNIKFLHLVYQNITDISALSHLTLVRLNIACNFVVDLSPLSNMENLVELQFDKNPVEDLSPLANNKQLGCLSAERTYISDLTPIAGLSDLEYIYLKYTNVEDLSPISHLELTDLFVEGCNIQDYSIITNADNFVTE